MYLFTAQLPKGLEKSKQSEAAYALVRYAFPLVFGEPCPKILRSRGEKPLFEDAADCFFSVSHSGDRVLVGLSRGALGVDVERLRPLRPGLEARLLTPEMRRSFDFFQAWTARESVFKLTGQGNLMTMPLERGPEGITTPFPGVRCQTYTSLPGYAAAAAAYDADFPEEIVQVACSLFFS